MIYHQAVMVHMNPFSFHNKLKTNPKYLNHHVNRRCDDLIEILLLFEEGMFHQRKYLEIISQPSAEQGVDHQRTVTEKDVKVHNNSNNIRSLMMIMMMTSSVLHPPKTEAGWYT